MFKRIAATAATTIAVLALSSPANAAVHFPGHFHYAPPPPPQCQPFHFCGFSTWRPL